MSAARQATWSISCRPAPVWAQAEGEPPHRPFLALVLDETAGTVLHLEFTREPPDGPSLVRLIERARRAPMVRGASPGRLVVEDQLAEVQAYARKHGLVCARGGPSALWARVVAGIAEEFEMANFGCRREAMVERLGTELTRAVFEAGLLLMRSEPWGCLQNSQVVETSAGAFAVVLGSGGEEFGLLLHPTLAAAESVFRGQAGAITAGLLLRSAVAVSFADLDFHQQSGLEPPPEGRWPVLFTGNSLSLPGPRETRLLLACLQALCEHQDHLSSQWLRPATEAPTAPRSTPSPAGAREGLDLRLGPVLTRVGTSDQDVEGWIAGWPKVNATARKLGRVLLEFLAAQEPPGATSESLEELRLHCWRLGALWSQRLTRYSLKQMLELGPCEADYRALHRPTAAELKRYRATWKQLERHLSR